MRRPIFLAFASCLLVACSSAPSRPKLAAVAEGTHAHLALLETTDVHSTVLSYDYFKVAADSSIGLERVSTLIAAARREFPNTLLFDDGDTIQGTSLADYQALVKPPACDQKLAIYKAMDALGYDAGTIGNHEFNYGLPFLARATATPMNAVGVSAQRCAGPDFPLVLSNVFGTSDGKPLYQPYLILERTITAQRADGSSIQVPIRIGLIGLAPPLIVNWDKQHLDGKVSVLGVVEAAQRYVPQLRAQGVDLVFALSHGGLNSAPYTSAMENANWHLAAVPGIDVMLMGHSHAVFPAPNDPKSPFKDMAEVDNQRGFVRGVPAVMGGFWGKDLGLIDLALEFRDGRWQIDPASTHSEVRPICSAPGACVAADPRIDDLIRAEHAATIAYVTTPIGRSEVRMSTYFADVGDVSALAVVNAAQRDYTERWIRDNRPQDASVPVLSAAAAFKAGFAGPEDYTDVPAGPLTISSAADLYLYPNTITAVKIDGAQLKNWLERSAQRFNQIDPTAAQAQPLLSKMPSYNFDVIQGGISYTIDIGKPQGSRIVELLFHGKPVDPAQAFIVVSNNYRLSASGGIPGFQDSQVVMANPDGNREVVIAWLKAHGDLHPADLEASPWRFAKLVTRSDVTFVVGSGKAAAGVAAQVSRVELLSPNADGSATYRLRLGE